MLFPEIKAWDVFQSSQSKVVLNWQLVMHPIFSKAYYLLIFSLWFVTNKKWWRFCLTPALILVVYQLLSLFLLSRFEDNLKLLVVLAIITGVIYITFLNFIHKRIKGLLFSDTKILSSDLINLIQALNSQKKVLDIKTQTINSIGESKLKKTQRSLRDLESNRQYQEELNYTQQAEVQSSKIKEIVIATILISLPVLFYSYRLVPEELYDLEIFGFTFEHGFYNLQTFVYYLITKVYLLSFLIIWYLTTKNYWKYGILINIIVTFLQTTTLLFGKVVTIMDEYEMYYAMPVLIPILLILLLVYKVYTYQNKISIIDDKLDLEINEMISGMKQEDVLNSTGKLLRNLMENKYSMSEEKYVAKLSVLKNRLSQELQHLNNPR
tara:strand:+ start:202 stop:1341 length:1140 start_codon:yes stop_codon:yes gene_type:complete